MSVRPKPKQVEDFIREASIDQPGTQATEKTGVQPVKLRLPQELLEQIDQAVEKRRPVPSRHQWILEAIYEKLDRSGG